MKKLPAGEFKARCLAVMEEVRKNREPVLITRRGKPVAKLVPADKTREELIGRLEGIVSRDGIEAREKRRRGVGEPHRHGFLLVPGWKIPDGSSAGRSASRR